MSLQARVEVEMGCDNKKLLIPSYKSKNTKHKIYPYNVFIFASFFFDICIYVCKIVIHKSLTKGCLLASLGYNESLSMVR